MQDLAEGFDDAITSFEVAFTDLSTSVNPAEKELERLKAGIEALAEKWEFSAENAERQYDHDVATERQSLTVNHVADLRDLLS